MDIACPNCDVLSLARPEPGRQVFAKFKHYLRLSGRSISSYVRDGDNSAMPRGAE